MGGFKEKICEETCVSMKCSMLPCIMGIKYKPGSDFKNSCSHIFKGKKKKIINKLNYSICLT